MRLGCVVCVCLWVAASAQAQDDDSAPLSAIDWLSESVEQPQVVVTAPPTVLGTQSTRTPPEGEAPVANSATTPTVSVQPLGAPPPQAVGVLTSAATGLSDTLWQGSDAATLAALMQAQDTGTLPALRDLLVTLALLEAHPPSQLPGPDTFLLARVDTLLEMGALEPAQALLEAAVPDTPLLYQRWFDVSLLTGTENAACRSLRSKPDVAPTPAAQIFCLARSGDWSAAALTLNTGRALGDIDAPTGALLARFLDPEMFEGEDDLPQPSTVTPLTFRMFEAIGAPLSTNGLPLAFAHADLRDNVGWKAQIEAAEHLAEAGAVDDNVLIGLYTDRRPAASGGIWERAAAVQSLAAALAAQDASDTADALTGIFDEVPANGILLAIAATYAPDLISVELPATARAQQFELLLLSDRYEEAALIDALAATDPFLASVARGTPTDAATNRPRADIIRAAFAADPLPTLTEMSADGRTGEAILRTLATLSQGLNGDTMAFQDGIATLRALGLEDVARRTALHYLLLERS